MHPTCQPPLTSVDAGNELKWTDHWVGTRIVRENVALRAGSSKHGNARRASVDSNCCTAAIPGTHGKAGVNRNGAEWRANEARGIR